jgi:hypothetical protein
VCGCSSLIENVIVNLVSAQQKKQNTMNSLTSIPGFCNVRKVRINLRPLPFLDSNQEQSAALFRHSKLQVIFIGWRDFGEQQ